MITSCTEPWPDSSLLDLFAESVSRYGDRYAVVDENGGLTYSELDRESDSVAATLADRGVTTETRVGIHLERSTALFPVILGILKAGGVYVAVDPRYPDARRDQMISASGASVVIEDQGAAEQGTVDYARGGDVSEITDVVRLHDACSHPATTVRPEDAASLLFTSGSSGAAKPIVLEHRNIVSFARNRSLPPLTPDDRVGQISSISFDAFHYEMWSTLAHGARVVVLPRVARLLDTDLQRQLKRYGVTAMLVPTMVLNYALLDDRAAFSSLRILQAGGDVLLPSVCRDLRAGGFRGELVNLYGPAEATTACTGHRVSEYDAHGDTVPIGRPLDGVTVRVLDAARAPVGAGELGELYVAGPGVARGYQDQPELTAERFLVLDEPAGPRRFYRTGDLVRRREDGVLLFVGRADDQVKVRGYRVEPGEVEAGLRHHPSVREAAVMTVGTDHDRQLVAFVVLDEEFGLSDLRAHAEARLPDFMNPSRYVVLNRIPATEHGKRDTAALADLLAKDRERAAGHAPPRSETERYLARLWGALVGVDAVGRDEDFFELGGHSLLAFRMSRTVAADLELTVAFPTVLENTVLRDLAAVLDSARAG